MSEINLTKKEIEEQKLLTAQKTDQKQTQLNNSLKISMDEDDEEEFINPLKEIQQIPVVVPKKKTKKELQKEQKEKIESAHSSWLFLCMASSKYSPDIKVSESMYTIGSNQMKKRMEQADAKLSFQENIRDFDKQQEKNAKEGWKHTYFTQEQVEKRFSSFAQLDIKSFKIKDDKEFVENLENNYAYIHQAEQVYTLLFTGAGGAFTIGDKDRELLSEKLALCSFMKEYMDAKLEVMKDPLYPYVADKDLTQAGAVFEVMKQLIQGGQISSLGEEQYRMAEFFKKVNHLQAMTFQHSRYFAKNGEKNYLPEFQKAVNARKDWFKTLFEKEETRVQDEENIKNYTESAVTAIREKQEEPSLVEEKKEIPVDKVDEEFHKALREFKEIPLTTLKAGTVDEILKKTKENAPLIRRAEEVHNLLLRYVSTPEMKAMTPDEIVEIRARMNVFFHVKEVERILLDGLESGKIVNREGTLDQWAKENGVYPITDAEAFYKKELQKLSNEQKNAKDTAAVVWKLLSNGKEVSRADQETKERELQRNILAWEAVEREKNTLRGEDAKCSYFLKNWCKENNREYQKPADFVLRYMRGKKAAELVDIYTKANGSPKEVYSLYKTILEETMKKLDVKDYSVKGFSAVESLAENLATKANLAEQAESLDEIVNKLRNLEANPELVLEEKDKVSEQWEKEAKALSALAKDHLSARTQALFSMTGKENQKALSMISMSEMETLVESKESIIEYLKTLPETSEEAKALTNILNSMGGLVKERFSYGPELEEQHHKIDLHTDLTGHYMNYRTGAGLQGMDLRTKALYDRVAGKGTDPVYTKRSDLIRLRKDCLDILSSRYEEEEDSYFHLSTAQLQNLAMEALKDDLNAEDFKKKLDSMKLEGNDALADSKWEESEEKILSLAKDLSGFGDPTETDKGKRRERFRQILSSNAELLAWFLKNKEKDNDTLFANMKKKLPLQEGNLVGSLRENLSGILNFLQENLKEQRLTTGNVEKLLNNREIEEDLKTLLDEADEKMEQSLDACMDGVLVQLDYATDDLFVAAEEQKDDGIPELRKMLRQSLNKESGQGKFIYLTLKNYFKSSSKKDKRRMMFSMFKDMKPIQELKLSEEEQKEMKPEELEAYKVRHKEMEKKRQAGRYLGGLLKGAGPLFQKMMQGIPDEMISADLREALKDVKTRLEPIDPEYVQSKLTEMQNASGGKVTRIVLNKSLGAASVGQAFLCRIFGPELPKVGKDVVIKILRPNLKERMDSEKRILFDCAEKVSGSMKKDYEEQLKAIEKELDLTLEAKNAEMGFKTYHGYKSVDKEDEVTSANLVKEIPAAKDYMVLEKGEGVTLEDYIEEMNERLDREWDEYMKPFTLDSWFEKKKKEVGDKEARKLYIKKKDEVIKRGADRGDPAFVSEETWPEYLKQRDRLKKMLNDAVIRQKHVVMAADLWSRLGLFGKDHFFHGDLHAGNILISEDKATLIDYGNASRITDAEQHQIIAMIGALTQGSECARDFLWAFIQLLPKEENEGQFKRQNGANETEHPRLKGQGQKFLNEITKIMDKTNEFAPEDAEDPMIGEKVALILQKAQEFGLRLPPAVQLFSQGELRIQNALTDMNNLIGRIRNRLKDLDNLVLDEEPAIDIIKLSKEESSTEQGYRTTRDLCKGFDEELFKEEVRQELEVQQKDFKKHWCGDLLDFKNVPKEERGLNSFKEIHQRFRQLFRDHESDPEEIKRQTNLYMLEVDNLTMPYIEEYDLNWQIDDLFGGKDRHQAIRRRIYLGDPMAVEEYFRVLEEYLPAIFEFVDNLQNYRDYQDMNPVKKVFYRESSYLNPLVTSYRKLFEIRQDQEPVFLRVRDSLRGAVNDFGTRADCETFLESYIKREEKAKKNGTWEDTPEYPDLTRAKEIRDKLHKMEDRLREKYQTSKDYDFTRGHAMTDPKDQQEYKELLQSYLREMNYLNHIMQVTVNTRKIKKELHDWFSDGEQGHALQKAYEEYLSVQEQSLNILRYGVTLTEEEKSKGVTKGQVEEKNRLLLLEKENAFMKAYKAVAKGRMDAMIRDHFDGEHKGKPIRLDLNLKDMMSTITRVAKDNKAGMATTLLRTDPGLARKLM